MRREQRNRPPVEGHAGFSAKPVPFVGNDAIGEIATCFKNRRTSTRRPSAALGGARRGSAGHAIIRALAVCVTASNCAGESSATSGTVSREGFRLAAVDEIGRSRSPLQRP